MTSSKKKEPWKDVPIEVLIEFERKKRKKDSGRQQIPLSLPLERVIDAPEDNFSEEQEIKISLR